MEPGIEILAAADGISIRQSRPAVSGLLAGLPLSDALTRIPHLLPICGNAQEIAGRRAADAARGTPAVENQDQRHALAREQALAAAWRLAIDWPLRFGQDRDMTLLKTVRSAPDRAGTAAALLKFFPALDAAADGDELMHWVGKSDCPPARVLRRVFRLEASLPPAAPAETCAGEELVERARNAFAQDSFDPLMPAAAGFEVGPLAMRRHPAIDQLCLNGKPGSLSRRLLALILDTLAIARALLDDDAGSPVDAWCEDKGIGIGRAMTARGPVFHRVELDPGSDDTVVDWRVLAPTDWHFAPGGPLVREAAALNGDSNRLAILVLGFDPCAPWTVAQREQADA